MIAALAARRMPLYAWLGLTAIAISEIGMLARVQPFYSWHTPTAWTGYILFVDGIVWMRRGNSWLTASRAEFAFLATMSIPLWVVFEVYNKYFIHNWYYIGLPDWLPLRYFGYAWSFSTISPAIFETGDLVASLRSGRTPPPRVASQRLGPLSWVSIGVGLGMLLLPVLRPSPYLAAPVWLGFIFLLDPLNARAGSESLLTDFRHRRTDRLVNLMVAGLACGLLWEFWNYWAGTKWIYTVPILPGLRLFEMPMLGFGGFPPFALECFVMYSAVRRWLWRGAARPISV